jgi:hypothetical protein
VGGSGIVDTVDIQKSERINKVQLNEDYTYIGKIGDIVIYSYSTDGEEYLIRLCLDTGGRSMTCVGVLDLAKDRRGIYSVMMVRIAKEYQGFNIAPKLYRMAMKKLGISISTYSCQSLGGRSIWTRLFQLKDVQIAAYRRGSGTPRKVYPVYFDEYHNRLEGDKETIWKETGNWELVASV